MALKRSGMVEVVTGTGPLQLTMQAGESARIKDIRYFITSAASEDITLKINRRLITNFVAPSGWYLLARDPSNGYVSVWEVLKKLGLAPEYPLASGETLEISGMGANDYIELEYDLYDEGDVRNDEPNGSNSAVYTLFQSISNSTAGTSTGDVSLDQSDIDSAFPAFPAGTVVPARKRMRLRAVYGCPAYTASGTAHGFHTTRIKMIKDQEDLFDKDLNGLLFYSDTSAVSPSGTTYKPVATSVYVGQQYVEPKVLVLDPPIDFEPGEELNVFITIDGTAGNGNFTAGQLALGLVFDVERI